MKTKSRFTGVLFALGMLLAGSANADVLSTQVPGSFQAWSGADWQAQPIADLLVTNNVGISNFGVYGQASSGASLTYLIFDMSSASTAMSDPYGYATGQFSPVWSSGPISVNAGTNWFSSPTVNRTLLAGHTYSLGVWASALNFGYGYSSAPGGVSDANLTIVGSLGATSVFPYDSSLVVRDPLLDDPFGQASLRVSYTVGGVGAPLGDVLAPPVPEPAEWTMLIAGLLVVSFVANRQRKHRV